MSETPRAVARDYVDDLIGMLTRFDLDDVGAAVAMVRGQLVSGGAIFIAGNGGSAAVAEHMASDWRAAAVATGRRAGEITSLTSNTARLTAIANDYSYDEVFERQLAERALPGDLLVCLSVSGMSTNIVKAVECARALGVRVLGLAGQQSPLVDLSDVAVLIDVDCDYGLAEDMQSVFVHLVARGIRGVRRHRAAQPGGAAAPGGP